MKPLAAFMGVIFGFLLVSANFTEYDVIHQGLLLHNARIFLVMGSTMVISAGLLWVMEKRGWVTPLGGRLQLRRRSIERKHIYGGILFGIGWAISGTCPAVSAAMLGSGHLMGLFVMIGLFFGTLLRDMVVRWQSHRGRNLPTTAQEIL
jgi:uncharacterized protein